MSQALISNEDQFDIIQIRLVGADNISMNFKSSYLISLKEGKHETVGSVYEYLREQTGANKTTTYRFCHPETNSLYSDASPDKSFRNFVRQNKLKTINVITFYDSGNDL